MAKIKIGIIGAGGRGIYTFGYLFSREFAADTQVRLWANRTGNGQTPRSPI